MLENPYFSPGMVMFRVTASRTPMFFVSRRGLSTFRKLEAQDLLSSWKEPPRHVRLRQLVHGSNRHGVDIILVTGLA